MNGLSVPAALEYLGFEVDEQILEIIDILESSKTISENDIAEKMGLKINQARKSLYKLHEIGFVEYSKKKDEEKKWWYIYFWSLNKSKLKDIYHRHKIKELEQKQDKLKNEQKFSFECRKCKNDQTKFEYQDALSSGFSCTVCSKPLSEIKNSKLIQQLEKEISALKKEIHAS